MKFVKTAIVFTILTVSNSANSAICLGNCGNLGADGDISLPPTGNNYDWVSTFNGPNGVGQLSEIGGTNGSTLTSDPFFAATGSKVEFYFNYVTSDGAGYADYGWSKLNGQNSGETIIFTARTKATGNIVPGQGLPPVDAILDPSSVQIIPNQTDWSPLGNSSGTCYSGGCGNTGWVKSTFEVSESDTYTLEFGVSNWSDTAYQSGLAFDGLTLDGLIIGDGSSPESPLLPTDEIGDDGSFNFEFTPTPDETVFIDPWVAIGYDYELSGTNAITSVQLPGISGDTDGYEILDDAGNLLATINPGEVYTFGAPVNKFSVGDIDTDALLDPNDPTAFVTGLDFLNGDPVSISQTPIQIFVPTAAVPEPSTFAMMIGGLGLVGLMVARRKKA